MTCCLHPKKIHLSKHFLHLPLFWWVGVTERGLAVIVTFLAKMYVNPWKNVISLFTCLYGLIQFYVLVYLYRHLALILKIVLFKSCGNKIFKSRILFLFHPRNSNNYQFIFVFAFAASETWSPFPCHGFKHHHFIIFLFSSVYLSFSHPIYIKS